MDFLNKYLMSVALEADDITTEVNDTLDKTLGTNRSVTDGSGTDAAASDDNITETDILGSDTGTDDNDLGEEEDTGPVLDEGEAAEDGLDDIETPEPKKDSSLYNKNTLKKNMILFHGIVASNVNMLVECVNNAASDESTSVFNQVLANYRQIQEKLFQLITKDLFAEPYEELMRQYIALSRVHELGIRMLQIYITDPRVQKLKRHQKTTTHI